MEGVSWVFVMGLKQVFQAKLRLKGELGRPWFEAMKGFGLG
jgi:hypothetical protein